MLADLHEVSKPSTKKLQLLKVPQFSLDCYNFAKPCTFHLQPGFCPFNMSLPGAFIFIFLNLLWWCLKLLFEILFLPNIFGWRKTVMFWWNISLHMTSYYFVVVHDFVAVWYCHTIFCLNAYNPVGSDIISSDTDKQARIIISFHSLAHKTNHCDCHVYCWTTVWMVGVTVFDGWMKWWVLSLWWVDEMMGVIVVTVNACYSHDHSDGWMLVNGIYSHGNQKYFCGHGVNPPPPPHPLLAFDDVWMTVSANRWHNLHMIRFSKTFPKNTWILK